MVSDSSPAAWPHARLQSGQLEAPAAAPLHPPCRCLLHSHAYLGRLGAGGRARAHPSIAAPMWSCTLQTRHIISCHDLVRHAGCVKHVARAAQPAGPMNIAVHISTTSKL